MKVTNIASKENASYSSTRITLEIFRDEAQSLLKITQACPNRLLEELLYRVTEALRGELKTNAYWGSTGPVE